jgi:phage baseplate assembly protein W
MITYRGFSTLVNQKKFSLTDYALAKQDLINYFRIRKGQKLMQPSFGTIIWDQLFEPLNETTRDIISNDIKRIVAYDPRLQVNNVTVTEQTNGLQVEIVLTYIPSNQVDTIALNFDKHAASLTTN